MRARLTAFCSEEPRCAGSDTRTLAQLNRSLVAARGYYLSASHDPDNLDRAEVSLNELISTVDANIDPVGDFYAARRYTVILIYQGPGSCRVSTTSMDAVGCSQEKNSGGV